MQIGCRSERPGAVSAERRPCRRRGLSPRSRHCGRIAFEPRDQATWGQGGRSPLLDCVGSRHDGSSSPAPASRRRASRSQLRLRSGRSHRRERLAGLGLAYRRGDATIADRRPLRKKRFNGELLAMHRYCLVVAKRACPQRPISFSRAGSLSACFRPMLQHAMSPARHRRAGQRSSWS